MGTGMTTATNEITDGTFGDLPTKVLRHGPSGSQAEILLRGATLLSWRAPWGGEGTAELIDGYRDQADFERQHGGRSAILLPFANRLRDNRYTFDGVTHEVGLQYPVDKEVIHGNVRMSDWTVVAEDATDPRATSLTLTCSVRPEDSESYPFSLDATVRFELTAGSLDVRLEIRNVGEQDAPVAAGWHPYFLIPGHDRIDGLALRVPGRAAIVMDENLIPLAGAEAYEPRTEDLVHGTLEGVAYDHAWVRLVADTDGRVRTVLSDPRTGDGVAVWQQHGTVLVFTGETLDRPRESVAIEPLESITDAFNRPDREAEVRLPAGVARTFSFGAEVVRGRQ